ncbi:MAG: hypothetical protein CBC97_05875, partial [Verrucomicrobiaceae bacterium TMED137]
FLPLFVPPVPLSSAARRVTRLIQRINTSFIFFFTHTVTGILFRSVELDVLVRIAGRISHRPGRRLELGHESSHLFLQGLSDFRVLVGNIRGLSNIVFQIKKRTFFGEFEGSPEGFVLLVIGLLRPRVIIPLSPPCIPPNPGFRDFPAKSNFLGVTLWA